MLFREAARPAAGSRSVSWCVSRAAASSRTTEERKAALLRQHARGHAGDTAGPTSTTRPGRRTMPMLKRRVEASLAPGAWEAAGGGPAQAAHHGAAPGIRAAGRDRLRTDPLPHARPSLAPRTSCASPATTRRWAHRTPGIVVLAEAGHPLNIEKVGEFNDLVRRFLLRPRRGRRGRWLTPRKASVGRCVTRCGGSSTRAASATGVPAVDLLDMGLVSDLAPRRRHRLRGAHRDEPAVHADRPDRRADPERSGGGGRGECGRGNRRRPGAVVARHDGRVRA